MPTLGLHSVEAVAEVAAPPSIEVVEAAVAVHDPTWGVEIDPSADHPLHRSIDPLRATDPTALTSASGQALEIDRLPGRRSAIVPDWGTSSPIIHRVIAPRLCPATSALAAEIGQTSDLLANFHRLNAP
jgi:hypothetical protein